MSRRGASAPARTPGRRRPQARPAPTRCARADDVWPYLDGELPAARARTMAGHIAGCESCGSVARRLWALLDECRSEGCRSLPPEVRARAQARVQALLSPRRAR